MSKTKTETQDLQDQYWKSTTGMDSDCVPLQPKTKTETETETRRFQDQDQDQDSEVQDQDLDQDL